MPNWSNVPPPPEAATMNVHTLSGPIGVPAASVTLPAILAVYDTPAAKFEMGFRVATVLPEPMVTVAGTGVPPLVGTSVKVEVVTVDGFIASLKVATTLDEAATLLAPSAGFVDTTVGGVFGPETPCILISLMLAQSFWLLPLTVTLTYWAFTSAKL